MLTKFVFRNFKSFRDDTILDLSASKITEYADHLFDTGIEKIDILLNNTNIPSQ